MDNTFRVGQVGAVGTGDKTHKSTYSTNMSKTNYFLKNLGNMLNGAIQVYNKENTNGIGINCSFHG